jgi:GT2 family glycosyltransferase
MKKPTTSIIILSFNNWPFTKTCISSIYQNTLSPEFEVIIVDNASKQETRNSLQKLSEEYENLTVLNNPKNYGFAKANNQGAKLAKGDYLVFLNNDTIVSPGWLEKLLSHLQNIPDAGMVGPVTNAIGNEAKIDVDYVEPTLEAVDRIGELRTKLFSGRYFKIKVLALFCCIIPKQLFEEIEGLDERYKIGTFEDDDLAMKIYQRGLNLYCAEDVFIHHYHGASFNKLSLTKRLILFQVNKFKFERKWRTKWEPHQNRSSNN